MKRVSTQSRQALRKVGTAAEAVLWMKLKNRQVENAKFRRQHPIGPFVVDFCCVERMLIIEVDGSIHTNLTVVEKDMNRTEYLVHVGYRLIRFTNKQVFVDLDNVIDAIRSELLA